nr:hypothetical protein [Verrucomicrobiales bacterium]
LFAELFAHLARDRAGVIVPTGIATDATTAPFFAHLVETQRLARLVDFENSAPLFPGVHRSFKFSLLTLGREEREARFAFFLTDPAQLAEPERNFTLTPETIARLNPNTKTAPVFRSRADAELTAKIYRNAPVLIEEGKGNAGNPWGVDFRQGLFNMTSDSHLFRTVSQLSADGWQRDGSDWVKDTVRYVPLYEAKMIHQFDHRWATYGGKDEGEMMKEEGHSSRDVTIEEKQNPAFEPAPRYWVPQSEVDTRLAAKNWQRQWLMGWRDITNATNERTVIATVFPRSAVGNQLPLMVFPKGVGPAQLVALSGCLSSITLDYAARFKVGGTHLNFFIYQQLPILPPAFYTAARLDFIVPRVLELTYTSHALRPFYEEVMADWQSASSSSFILQPSPFAWNEERRALLRSELDAFYARAYGLDRDELRYLLDPAAVKGPAYPSETFRVLKEKELSHHGEYRTQRLVLEAWDRMQAEGTFAQMAM